jgi:hypothetical protein
MKVEQLLEQLKQEQEKLTTTITLIESQLRVNGTKEKRRNIVKATKKLHWTQMPKNKARLKRQLKLANQIRLNRDIR